MNQTRDSIAYLGWSRHELDFQNVPRSVNNTSLSKTAGHLWPHPKTLFNCHDFNRTVCFRKNSVKHFVKIVAEGLGGSPTFSPCLDVTAS